MAQQANILSQQKMEIVVSGPGSANRMFITTGIAIINIGAFENVPGAGATTTQRAAFSALVDPVLTDGQFRKAVATASLASVSYTAQDPTQRVSTNWTIDSVDADWDDESGKVELRFEVAVTVGGLNSFGSLASIGFQVTTLATLPQ